VNWVKSLFRHSGLTCVFFLYLSRFLSVSLSIVHACLTLSHSLAYTPGSVVHHLLGVRVCVWVWPGVDYAVSGKRVRKIRNKVSFDKSSPEPSAFVECLDLSWFPHRFAKILWYWVPIPKKNLRLGLIYFFDQILDFPLFGGVYWLEIFCFVLLHYTVSREVTITVPWPMNGAQVATETYRCSKNEPWTRPRLSEEMNFCSKVCITNHLLDQFKFFFTEVSESKFLRWIKGWRNVFVFWKVCATNLQIFW